MGVTWQHRDETTHRPTPPVIAQLPVTHHVESWPSAATRAWQGGALGMLFGVAMGLVFLFGGG